MDNISVVIRNRNEKDYIGFAIQSCLDSFKDPEIIIVDNGTTDDSLQIVDLFNWSNIKVININNYSPGIALNTGVSQTSNPHVLIMSAHTQITKLNADVKGLLNDYKAVFGNQIPIYRGKRINKRYIWSHFINNAVMNMYSKIEGRYFLHNAFCFYDRNFLIEYPFDETLSGKEDRYWADNLVNVLGEKYFYTPQLESNHYWTPNGATWKGLG